MTFQIDPKVLRLITWTISSLVAASAAVAEDSISNAARISFPDFQTLANSPQKIRLLPGQADVVFTI